MDPHAKRIAAMPRPVPQLLALGALALQLAACAGDPSDAVAPTPTAPGMGSLLVSVKPKGSAPQGIYRLVIDGVRLDRESVAGGNTTVSLPAGPHDVRLDDLPAYCAAAENPRVVNLAQDKASATTFEVVCTGASIGTRTEGIVLDDDGYSLMIDGDTAGARRVSSQGTSTLGVPAGARRLTLIGVAPNCTAADNPRTVDVAPVGTNDVTFQVSCVGGVLRVEVATSGLDSDFNGYTVRVRGDGTVPDTIGHLASDDGRAIGAWRDGTQVTAALEDVQLNCRTDAPSRAATIRAHDTVTVRFAVTCAALPPSTILASTYAPGNGRTEVIRLIDAQREFISIAAGSDAEWAPGGAAFAYADGPNLLLSEAGGRPRVVARGINPVFAPDARRLLFLEEPDCDWGCTYPSAIRVIDLDQPLQSPGKAFDGGSGASISSFDLSPDGRRVAYFPNDQYTIVEVVLAELDGSSTRLALPTGISVNTSRPRFSPDGREILVNLSCPIGPLATSDDCGFIVPVDGSPGRRLPNGRALAWSPDGSRILVAEILPSSSRFVTMRSSDGQDRQELATVPGYAQSASWRR
jgi:hypothetical protein